MSGTITTFTQDGRFLTIDCALPTHDVVLTNLDGAEQISAPFSYHAGITTLSDDKKVRELLGKTITLWLRPDLADGEPRPLHGIVRQISGPNRISRGLHAWNLELVPRLALLGLAADCKIFQDMSVVDIVKSVLDAHNVTYRLSVTGTYPPLDYCVQYRETALNFVSRLMESVGLFYWHEHTASTHTMVIVDSNLTAKPALDHDALTEEDSTRPDVTDVHENYAFRSGKWSLTDFDFKTPKRDLSGSTPTTETTAGLTDFEMYDYPGTYALSADAIQTDGKKQTRLRIENEEAHFHRVTGTGHRVGLAAGCFVKFGGGDFTAQDEKLLLTDVTVSASDPAPSIGTSQEASFSCAFTAIPHAKPFRPDRLAAKPFVRGVQTAIVTGPSGEKIYTDQYGRVKVKFFWDRLGHEDDKSSCWLRVSQVWADKGFGAIHIPRIGQEVIVDFLEGDPDRPIVTGRVYNGANTVPYGLPGNKTQSGFKSASMTSGHNEFRFEDKGGSEEVYLHAQKDLTVKVENNEQHDVVVDRTTTVGGKDERTVTGITKDTLDSTYIRKVASGVTDTISAGGETRTVTGGITETVTGDVVQTVAGNITNTVTAAISLTAPAGINLTSATSVTITQPLQWQTGNTCLQMYNYNVAVYGINAQTAINNSGVYATQVNIIGVNVSLNTLNLQASILEQTNAPIKLKESATEIATSTTNINILVLALFV